MRAVRGDPRARSCTSPAYGTIARDRGGVPDVELLTPNTLGVRHWSRLLGGLLYATSPRLSWPLLRRRTFDIDILDCAKCHGRLRVVAAIAEVRDACRILECLGVPGGATASRARPRSDVGGARCADRDGQLNASPVVSKRSTR